MNEQNMAILKALASMAWADGAFAETETEMIEALSAAFEANDDEAKAIREYFSQSKTMDDMPLTELSADDRRVLLQHAVLLAFVDGEATAGEWTFINALPEKLRIPEDEAKELISVAEARARRFVSLL